MSNPFLRFSAFWGPRQEDPDPEGTSAADWEFDDYEQDEDDGEDE